MITSAASRPTEPLPGSRVLIVEARYYDGIADELLAGARAALARAEVEADVLTVDGALEIPATIAIALEIGQAEARGYDAAVALGCVIRGETGHYDHVAGQAAAGVQQAALATGVPVIFGILTTDTVEQALNRAGLKGGNKGADAALSAIEMVNLWTRIKTTAR